MTFEETIKKIQAALIPDKYNILGYPYSDDEKKKLEPWFYLKKEKLGMPPFVGEWMAKLSGKYPLAAQSRRKLLGRWAAPIYFCVIRADGMQPSQLKAKFLEFREDMLARFKWYEDKKVNIIEMRTMPSIPMHMLAFVFEDGVSNELYTAAQRCWEGSNVEEFFRPLVIDVKGKRCDRGTGGEGSYMGYPNPKSFGPAIFG